MSNEGVGNADTAYAVAYLVRPPEPDVVVVTAKAPALASKLPGGGTDYGCRPASLLGQGRQRPFSTLFL